MFLLWWPLQSTPHSGCTDLPFPLHCHRASVVGRVHRSKCSTFRPALHLRAASLLLNMPQHRVWCSQRGVRRRCSGLQQAIRCDHMQTLMQSALLAHTHTHATPAPSLLLCLLLGALVPAQHVQHRAARLAGLLRIEAHHLLGPSPLWLKRSRGSFQGRSAPRTMRAPRTVDVERSVH